MTLTSDEAAAVTGLFVVGALSWAAFLSVGAAAGEATWARRHIDRAAIAIAALGVVGILMVIWIEPAWVGIGLLYISGILWMMSRWVGRTLRRADAFGGAVIAPAARKLLLLSTSRWMWIAAAVLSIATALDWIWRGLPAIADGVLVAVFAAAAWWAGNRADQLQ